MRAEHVPGGVGAERSERVGAEDLAALQPVDAVRPDRQGAVALGVDEQEADPLVVSELLDQARVKRLDPLEREPARLAGEADQPEAARGHHGELGWLLLARTALTRVALAPLLAGAGDVEPLGGRLQGPRDRVLVPIELGQARADVGARFRGAVGGGVGALRAAGLLDQILERVAVTLQEGCTLRLPMVGEDDQR